MIWWLAHRTRLSSEKKAITDLESVEEWLRVGRWYSKDNLQMCLEFDIIFDDEFFSFEMIYPFVYPDAPPMIYTKDRTRLSAHQYGAEGELCLEYRPDNWHSSITGAEMVRSCRSLLEAEKPKSDAPKIAPSAHIESLGRDMRAQSFRFMLKDRDIVALNSLPKSSVVEGIIKCRTSDNVYRSVFSQFSDGSSVHWDSELSLPDSNWTQYQSVIVHIDDASLLKEMKENDFNDFCLKIASPDLLESLSGPDNFNYLLAGDGSCWALYCVFGKQGDRTVIKYKTIVLDDNSKRIPDEFDSLAGCSVSIVGCGSIGSKIASSLCRSGIKSFLLIDEDLLLPENIVRNELDLSDIGLHKSYALRSRLLRINPDAEIKVLRVNLGGQESAKSMDSALTLLKDTDLIIDATANPRAFNIIASVSTRHLKPIVWVEVFAGGIGGLIARSRPHIDPSPATARAQILRWCEAQGVEWRQAANSEPYETGDHSGSPLIAGDAEVTIMAGNAARFASDILTNPGRSIFPNSVYIVGFSSEWLFNQPFDTRPITLRSEGDWGDDSDPWDPDEAAKLINEHFRPGDKGNEDTSTS